MTDATRNSGDRGRDLHAIIKAYDLRGLVPQQWDAHTSEALGAACADILTADMDNPVLAVGYDMRPSSPELAHAFAKGANGRGVDVRMIGLCSTDGLYFVSGFDGVPGAMFTASHNPAAYNGIKLCRAGAAAVGLDTGLATIRDRASAYLNDGVDQAARQGHTQTADRLEDYARYLRSLVDLSGARRLKVVVDAGNGMAGLTVPAVLGAACGLPELPLDIEPLYFELDGTFPNHEANPLEPSNLVDLQQAVREHGADLGLAFDGDADRCFAVDERGEPVSPSSVTALVAAREIARDRAAGEAEPVVLHNAITSTIVARTIADCGGRAVRTKVGHSHIKAEMARTGACFGGEHSAHYYFRDFWGADTGMLAAMHLLAALGETTATASECLAEYSTQACSGEINSAVVDQGKATARAVHALEELATVEVDTLDGTTITAASGSWWANVRPSNTEPLLRLNVEALDDATMRKVCDTALQAIRQTEETA